MRERNVWKRAAGLVLVAVASCAPRQRASAAQCEKLIDRYADLELSEDPRAPQLSTEQRARLRGRLALDVSTRVSTQPGVERVKTRCQTDVAEAAYRCAIAAPTTAAWSACIEKIE